MPLLDIKVADFPESVTDGTVLEWHKQPGDAVHLGDNLVDIETDKVVFETPAVKSGVLREVLVKPGDTVVSGQVIARVEEGAKAESTSQAPSPVAQASEARAEEKAASTETVAAPAARRLMAEQGIDRDAITGSGKDGRVMKEDVLGYIQRQRPASGDTPAPDKQPAPDKGTEPAPSPAAGMVDNIVELGGRPQQRVPMSRLRARVAERLLEAQHTAAILTTFNEINMKPVMDMRKQYGAQFERTHGVKLGFMSFFVKAVVEALKRFPEVNASIEGNDIVYHGFFDIGIAVGSERGLVVPVVRDVDNLSMAEIEKTIRDFAERANKGTLTLEELTGGTFTITNGGVYGSMLSTPIINPPQSAILGMHKIQDRPVAEDGQVVIRPVMYLALSYDHRIIDGRGAVQFLVAIKDVLEDPARLMLEV